MYTNITNVFYDWNMKSAVYWSFTTKYRLNDNDLNTGLFAYPLETVDLLLLYYIYFIVIPSVLPPEVFIAPPQLVQDLSASLPSLCVSSTPSSAVSSTWHWLYYHIFHSNRIHWLQWVFLGRVGECRTQPTCTSWLYSAIYQTGRIGRLWILGNGKYTLNMDEVIQTELILTKWILSAIMLTAISIIWYRMLSTPNASTLNMRLLTIVLLPHILNHPHWTMLSFLLQCSHA